MSASSVPSAPAALRRFLSGAPFAPSLFSFPLPPTPSTSRLTFRRHFRPGRLPSYGLVSVVPGCKVPRRAPATKRHMSAWPPGQRDSIDATEEDLRKEMAETEHTEAQGEGDHHTLPGPPGPGESASSASASSAVKSASPINICSPGGSSESRANEIRLSSHQNGPREAPSRPEKRPPVKRTIMHLQKLKQEGTPIVCLTAYDYPSALAVRSAPVDLCLIGDSLANVALGFSSTTSLILPALIHHARAAVRGLSSPLLPSPTPFVVADLPFGTFVSSVESGCQAAVEIVRETGVEAIKVEGGDEVVPLIRRLTQFGIPVMAHVGLQPQRAASTSGFRVQGRDAASALDIAHQAKELERAGAFAIVLECVPSKLAEWITARCRVPTIGIGAGSATDGQILVLQDMLGALTSPESVLWDGPSTSSTSSSHAPSPSPSADLLPPPHPFAPKFVRRFASVGEMSKHAVREYARAVVSREYPSEARGESYKMPTEEWRKFLESAQW